jgi:multidrug efflux pump subunit AcrA (membrane-fusion protein)
VVPGLSLIRLGGQHFAFVVDSTPSGLVVHQRAVAVGEQSGNRYVLRSGLLPGSRIVISGVQKLRDGGAVVEEKRP